jgi:hypothetical protein
MNFPKKIWKALLPLAALVVLVLGYVAIFARSTAAVYRAKTEALKNPALSLAPVPLPDTSVSQIKGKTEAFFGFQFEIPWKDGQVKNGNSAVMIISPSRREAMTFFNPAGEHGLVAMMKDTPGLRPELIYSLYGIKSAQSDYELARAAFYSSPLGLSLIMPSTRQVYAANLLWMKEAYLGVQSGEIYSFEIGPLRGFQHEDPARTRVVVDAFDAQDHKFTFIFRGMPGSDSGFKQSDVNRVLQTFKPADDDDDD